MMEVAIANEGSPWKQLNSQIVAPIISCFPSKGDASMSMTSDKPAINAQ